MKNINQKNYPNLDQAVAFRITFDPFIYFYDDAEMNTTICDECYYEEQKAPYRAPKRYCNRDYGILHSYEYGVSDTVYKELIDNFDITEDDFRDILNKQDEVVYHQIAPRHIMLPIAHVNDWAENPPCESCGRTYYNNIGTEFYNEKGEEFYYITKEALEDLHDLNVTYEKFRLYLPYWVVSRRVFDFLTEKYPRMRFEPFFLKD